MRATVESKNLKSAVDTAKRGVSARMALPLFTNLLLTADGEGLAVTGTDLTMRVTARVPAWGLEPGSVLVSAKDVTNLAKVLKGTLELNDSDKGLEFVSNGVTMSLPTEHDPNDYPLSHKTLPAPATILTLESSAFRSLLDRVLFAADANFERPVLTNALVEIQDSTLTLVASDGFRISKVVSLRATTTGAATKFLLPAKSLKSVRTLLPKTGRVTFGLAPEINKAKVHWPGVEVWIDCQEGQYPDYDKIIPTKTAYNMTVDTQQFADAVNMLAPVAQANGTEMIILEMDGTRLSLSIQNQARATAAQAHIACKGDCPRIAFKYRYLNDALKVVHTEELVFTTSGPSEVGCIIADGFIHAIMPCQCT